MSELSIKTPRAGESTDSVEEVHISSSVVRCLPDQLELIKTTINGFEVASVEQEDSSGKLIVLMETTNEHEIMTTLQHIESMQGVINASLVYHQID